VAYHNAKEASTLDSSVSLTLVPSHRIINRPPLSQIDNMHGQLQSTLITVNDDISMRLSLQEMTSC